MQKNCYIPPPQLHKSTWNLPTLSHPLHLQRHNYTDLRENAAAAAAAAKSPQLCPTLCDPIDGSPPGSPVPGILQARTLEWVAISVSNAWKWKVKVKSLSRVQLVATPWTVAYQAPPSMDFPGESTGVGCHCFLQEKTLLTWNSSLPSSPSLTKVPTKSLSLPLLTAKRFPFCHFRSIRNKQGADTNQDKRDGKSFLIIKS